MANVRNWQPYFVALTLNAFAGDRENYLKAVMDNYVSKPIDLAGPIGAPCAHPPTGVHAAAIEWGVL